MWNSTQAEALFAYSKKMGLTPETTLFGFELGEELTAFKTGTGAFRNYMASYQRAAKLLRSIFGSVNVPKLMGPCPGMSWPQLATYVCELQYNYHLLLECSIEHAEQM